MLQGRPHAVDFKPILNFGEGQASSLDPVLRGSIQTARLITPRCVLLLLHFDASHRVHEKMDQDSGRDKVGLIGSYCAVVEAVCGGRFPISRIVDRFRLGAVDAAIDRARAGEFHL
jgi:hypothetical protein